MLKKERDLAGRHLIGKMNEDNRLSMKLLRRRKITYMVTIFQIGVLMRVLQFKDRGSYERYL